LTEQVTPPYNPGTCDWVSALFDSCLAEAVDKAKLSEKPQVWTSARFTPIHVPNVVFRCCKASGPTNVYVVSDNLRRWEALSSFELVDVRLCTGAREASSRIEIEL